MANLYERLSSLCAESGITGYKMCADLSLSKNLMTELKSGRKRGLSAKTAAKIAAYFDVTVDYLLGNEDNKKTPVLTEKDRCDIAKELEAIRQRMEDADDLMFDGVPLSQEAKESIISAMQIGMEMVRRKNKEKYTPKKYKEE